MPAILLLSFAAPAVSLLFVSAVVLVSVLLQTTFPNAAAASASAAAAAAELSNVHVVADDYENVVWKDAYDLSLGGLAFDRASLALPFDRLPADAKQTIPEGVWNQSVESAGTYRMHAFTTTTIS